MNEVKPNAAKTDRVGHTDIDKFIEWEFVHYTEATYVQNLFLNICFKESYHDLSFEEREAADLADYETTAGKLYNERVAILKSWGVELNEVILYGLLKPIAKEILGVEV